MSKEIAKSNEMPEPKIMDYNGHYKLSDMFVNDLKKVLADVAYVDAKKFFDKIDQHNRIMANAQLTEFINDLQGLPYKVVAQLMGVINKKENFLKYFVPCDLPKQKQ
jgi:hypothetical protein